jgi:hypothetical protein
MMSESSPEIPILEGMGREATVEEEKELINRIYNDLKERDFLNHPLGFRFPRTVKEILTTHFTNSKDRELFLEMVVKMPYVRIEGHVKNGKTALVVLIIETLLAMELEYCHEYNKTALIDGKKLLIANTFICIWGDTEHVVADVPPFYHFFTIGDMVKKLPQGVFSSTQAKFIFFVDEAKMTQSKQRQSSRQYEGFNHLRGVRRRIRSRWFVITQKEGDWSTDLQDEIEYLVECKGTGKVYREYTISTKDGEKGSFRVYGLSAIYRSDRDETMSLRDVFMTSPDLRKVAGWDSRQEKMKSKLTKKEKDDIERNLRNKFIKIMVDWKRIYRGHDKKMKEKILTQTDVADMLGISAPQVSRILQELENDS